MRARLRRAWERRADGSAPTRSPQARPRPPARPTENAGHRGYNRPKFDPRRSRIPAHTLAFLIVAAAVTFGVAMAVTPGGVSYRELLDVRWHDFLSWLHGLFT